MNLLCNGKFGEHWTLPEYLSQPKAESKEWTFGEFTDTLSVRARKALYLLGVSSWETLNTITRRDLLSVKNCGLSSVRDIFISAKTFGVYLERLES